jgi:hypothetical protein
MFKINLNKELDYEIYKDFYNFSVAGADFGKEIKDEHPSITIENYKKYLDEAGEEIKKDRIILS